MMDKRQFLDFLSSGDFASLFNEAGWNRPASNRPFVCEIGAEKKRFVFREVAELFARVFVCETDALPLTAERNALDARLRRLGDAYVAIFVLGGPQSSADAMHHLWMVPVKSADRRSLVRVEYRNRDQSEFLFGKMQDLQFPIGSTPGSVDVLDRLNRAFQVNSADVTKRFYREFRLRHNAFVKGIRGIVDASDREWYASVMLNRLMFCYFVQKKGFLDLDTDYLSHKLAQVRETRGEDQFYGTFYKAFLRVLFAEGLNSRTRSKSFERRFGRIPYLNGGMFEVHALETKYPGIDIPDSVFEELFAFFDQWRWHLDTSITSTGRDINPDVLGYIFEQYINDRAQMGAYYTKEDITEYIARNTLVPWLLNETAKKSPAAFKPGGFVWRFLRESGDRYIFPAVKKGIDLPLPTEIERGVATAPAVSLRARRADWNRPADKALALPTEIWRETVARRERCRELRERISSGAIADVNDFITCNLDIRRFAEDLLAKTDDHLFVRHFYDALRRVTVLDPTCGSGAFLFAALNILEPLYETCLTRMQDDWPDKFGEELSVLRTKYRGNLKYCIYKSIILRNLYGVDIMREATEIARLRLFLKMVAVVDVDEMADNLGLDPLPDIDFNIRCGNTLVGFANPQGVKDAILPPDELALDQEAYDKVEVRAADISDLYERFKTLQQTAEDSPEFHVAKRKLGDKLAALNDELDRAMAHRQYNIDPDTLRGHREFEDWKRKTQPFHWYSEFYGITVANGGFDVIIGNPPYVASRKVGYPCGFLSEEERKMPDIYSWCILRSLVLNEKHGRFGMIVPLSITFSGDFKPLRSKLRQQTCWVSSFDNIPASIFEAVSQRCSIVLVHKGAPALYATRLYRWRSVFREYLASVLEYTPGIPHTGGKHGIIKSPSIALRDIVEEVAETPFIPVQTSKKKLLFSTTARNYISAFLAPPPCLDEETLNNEISAKISSISFKNDQELLAAYCACCGDFAFLYWLMVGDGFDVTKGNLTSIAGVVQKLDAESQHALAKLGRQLDLRHFEGLSFKKNAGKYVGSFNYMTLKDITRRSDALLLSAFGCPKESIFDLVDWYVRILSINESLGEKGIPADIRAMFPPRKYDSKAQNALFTEIDQLLVKHYGFTEGCGKSLSPSPLDERMTAG